MKEIDIDKLCNEKCYKFYDEHIKALYCFNHDLILNNLRQIITEKQDGQKYLQTQKKAVSSARIMHIFGESLQISDKKLLEELVDGLAAQRKRMVEYFNKAFNSNKTESDIFEDYKIVDEDYLDVFNLASTNIEKKQSTVAEERLYVNTNAYQMVAEWVMNQVSLIDMFNALCDDLTTEGNKSLFYSKPRDRVGVVSEDEIKFLVTVTEIYEKKLYENKKSNNDEFLFERNKVAFDEMKKIVCMWDERLKFANTPRVRGFSEFKEKTYLALAGVPLKAVKLKNIIKEVYFHQNEACLLFNAAQFLTEESDIKDFSDSYKVLQICKSLQKRAGGDDPLFVGKVEDFPDVKESTVDLNTLYDAACELSE